jgi:hypothetical protein
LSPTPLHSPTVRSFAALVGVATLAAFATPAVARNHPLRHRPRPHRILAFDTMYGVDGPFVGDAHPIDGIPGDELPWEIRAVSGHLFSNGFLAIAVHGLVFKDDPSVPEELRGKNDEAEFRAAVSCLTEEGDDVLQRNVVTEGARASESGNALILARVELPDPCVAPRVFVLAGSEDKWFAVTGFESEEGEE